MSEDNFKVYVENGDGNKTVKVKAEIVLDTDREGTERRNLGKSQQKCKICGASGNFQTWLGVENFFGSQDEFRYFECRECGVLQIEKFPDDIGKYYPSSYYSYREPKINPVRPDAQRDERMILDVGCGSGEWLCNLAELGCVNLYGCDPFIDRHIVYLNGVKIRKSSIHEMYGEFDLIHLRYSFEHMPDPHEVFKSFDRLLKHGPGAGGKTPKVEIIIPIFPNLAFDIYGPFWYQLDAPRHYFLYSEKSIKNFADANGFRIESIDYSSLMAQFVLSRAYQMGSSFLDFNKNLNSPDFLKLKEQLHVLELLGNMASISKNSDEARFTLVRK